MEGRLQRIRHKRIRHSSIRNSIRHSIRPSRAHMGLLRGIRHNQFKRLERFLRIQPFIHKDNKGTHSRLCNQSASSP
jgi:hypothetical protein